jgi:phage terminase large subunit
METGTTLRIEVAPIFRPLLEPSRYKGAHGGRGSGKSHFFAGHLVASAVRQPGLRAVCIREVQKSLKESAKRLIEDKVAAYGLGSLFRILESEIQTPGGGVVTFQGMQDHTAESIKSLEGYDIAWAEEAQSLSQRSLTLLRPTIRKDGSELWFSWNRTRKNDPVDRFLTGPELPTDCRVVKANWRDNPWFPGVLAQERQDDLRNRPDQYDHIWEGDYAKVVEGAYYAAALSKARSDGHIGRVAPDPLMRLRAFWDLGVRDATAIWIGQFVGREIRVLNYYEAVGQPLSSHVGWLHKNGYKDALCVLPHDAQAVDSVLAIAYEDHLRQAGFEVETVKNQGKGAAMKRVESARRLFPAIWFNEATTEHGRDALGSYHEKRDDRRNVGLGPEHDWSSHGADAFGLMCVAYEDPARTAKFHKKIEYPQLGVA